MCEKYNGWTNYETWNVALWNDFNDIAEEIYSNDSANALYNLQQHIKDFVEEFNPILDDASMYNDILGAALSQVDYYEIARHYIEELELE